MIFFKESPIIQTFQILSKKWTIEIIVELFKGRKRFSDLLEIDSALTSKVLSDRLKSLLDEGIINKIIINMMPLKVKYQITEKGRSLNKVFYEMALFTCTFYPEKVLNEKISNQKEIIQELRMMFLLDKENFEDFKKNYFN